jgi:hypothetical protein
MPFTDAEKLAEIERELNIRMRVYTWQVRKGKLSRETARRQVDLLIEIKLDYMAKIEAARPIGPLFAGGENGR